MRSFDSHGCAVLAQDDRGKAIFVASLLRMTEEGEKTRVGGSPLQFLS